MFSGLNKFLKIVLPKRLFYRALIIVAAPTIILQLIITIVFYDSIWIKANKNITRSLVTQLKAIQEVYQNDKKNLDFFTDSYRNNFNFEIDENNCILTFRYFPNTGSFRVFIFISRGLSSERCSENYVRSCTSSLDFFRNIFVHSFPITRYFHF